MSYCSNQWISDYTYEGIYNYMIAHPSLAPAASSETGDFLAVAGTIDPAGDAGGFALLRRLYDIANLPALVPGEYSLRLLDGANTPLGTYAFTPAIEPEAGALTFAQVIDFDPTAREGRATAQQRQPGVGEPDDQRQPTRGEQCRSSGRAQPGQWNCYPGLERQRSGRRPTELRHRLQSR